MIVQYGDRYMRSVPLSWEENGYCAALGATSLIWGLLLKFVPARWFSWIKLEEREMSAEEEQTSMMASMRKSHTMRKSQTSMRSSIRKMTTRKVADDDNFKNL